MKLQHECTKQVLFGVELPCAYCSPHQAYVTPFGPQLGWVRLPMATHPLGYISGPLRAEMVLRREAVALHSLDAPGAPHAMAHWVLSSINIPDQKHAVPSLQALTGGEAP